jgi:small subunit ribosomal protein S8
MDPIGNLLTTIRNAEAVNHAKATVPHSKVSMALLEILKKQGYIQNFTVTGEVKKSIVIDLVQGVPHTYKRISKPGRRLYTPARDIPTVLRGLGMVILSTPQGMMTGKDARKAKVGGELICEVS